MNERGMALLVALVIVVLLVAIIVEFDYGTRVALTAAGSFRDGAQATYLAKSGVTAARAFLKDDARHPDQYKSLKVKPCLDPFSLPAGRGTASFMICDESARLNVNLLAKPGDYERWKPIYQRLFEVLKIEKPGLVEAMKDWVDEDAETTGLDGAEADYYEQLKPPYTAKNGPLDSLAEIRLIKGITPEIYRKLMTGCDGKPCLTIAPVGKVNLNTVSLEVCQALGDIQADALGTQGEPLEEELCKRLIAQRPYENLEEINAVPGWAGPGGVGGPLFKLKMFNLVDYRSDHFSIQAIGEVHETRRVAEVLVKRQGDKTTLLSWRLE